MGNPHKSWTEPLSREPDPGHRLCETERTATSSRFSDAERRVISRVWRLMREQKPHYYVVLKSYVENTHYRGFYTDLSKHLGITPNAVKKRLSMAIRWFSDRYTRLNS